jgi:hypothetical protein
MPGRISGTHRVTSTRPSAISSQIADATIGFVAEKMQNRVVSVAAPNVSNATISPSRLTAI